MHLRSRPSPLQATASSPANVRQDETPVDTKLLTRSHPDPSTLLHLETYIKPFVDPETYNTYESIIINLARPGHRDVKIRSKYLLQLERLVREDEELSELHDEYARLHNERNVGKQESILLPVYEVEAGQAGIEEMEMEHEEEPSKSERSRSATAVEEKAFSRSQSPDGAMMDSTQVDGAHDADTSIANGGIKRFGATGAAAETQVQSQTRLRTPIDLGREDVEMKEVDTIVSTIHTASNTLADEYRGNEAIKEADEETVGATTEKCDYNTGLSMMDNEQESLSSKEKDERSLTEFITAHTRASPSDILIASATVPESLTKGPSKTIKTPATEAASEDELDLSEQAGMHVDTVTEASGKDVRSQHQPSVNPIPPFSHIMSPATSPQFRRIPAQAAQSYLTWLHQRQTRFPNARPVYSECITIGKRLGRPPHKVYDEVLYHWGLETDSTRGDWYKQNRLDVLGEDPRFDEETMGFWGAWMSAGKDATRSNR